MARDNGMCVCVVKPHGVSDKPLGSTILHGSEGGRSEDLGIRVNHGSR
jgi:hypothetical protein